MPIAYSDEMDNPRNPKFVITLAELAASNDPVISALVARQFTDSKAEHDRDINELRFDLARQTTLNDKLYQAADYAENFEDFLGNLFPGEINGVKHATLLGRHYTQGLFAYPLIPLNNAVNAANPDLHVREINNKSKQINIFYNRNDTKIYLECHFTGLEVIEPATWRKCQINGTKWTYVLEANGFKLCDVEICDERTRAMYIDSIAPARLEEYPEFSLRSRVRDAFHETFNASETEYDRDALAFVTGHRRATNAYGRSLEALELLATPFTLAKNILKLFTEFFPRAIEKSMEHLVIQFRASINNQMLLGFANLIPTLIFGGAWAFRQIASRLTSPVTGLRSAYAIGAQTHPVIGMITATLSATLSLALMIAAGTAAVAACSAIGASAIVTAANWITSHTTVIGSAFSLAVTKAAALSGISLSATAAAVVAASAIISTIVAGAMAMRMGIKTLLTVLFERNSRKLAARNDNASHSAAACEPTIVSGSDNSIRDRLDSLSLHPVTPPASPHLVTAPAQEQPAAVVSTSAVVLFKKPAAPVKHADVKAAERQRRKSCIF